MDERETIGDLYRTRKNLYQCMYHLFQIHLVAQKKQIN